MEYFIHFLVLMTSLKEYLIETIELLHDYMVKGFGFSVGVLIFLKLLNIIVS